MKNRQLVHELLDAVLDVHAAGDFAFLDVTNFGYDVHASHMSGGFDTHKKYDFYQGCDFGNTEKLQEMIDYFKGIKKALTPGSN